jgi:hypothetical protein
MFYTNIRSPVKEAVPDGETAVASRANLNTVSDERQARFIAGGPRRVRHEGEGFWAFLLGWIASLFRVDRRM